MLVSISARYYNREPFFLGNVVVPEHIVRRIAQKLERKTESSSFNVELQAILEELWAEWQDAEPDCGSNKRFCEWLVASGDWVKTDQVCSIVLQTKFI